MGQTRAFSSLGIRNHQKCRGQIGKKKKEPGCALDAPTKQRQPHALCDCTHHLMPHLQRYTIHNQEIFQIQESNQAHTGLIL
jgi:hypothetical protein